MSDSSLIQLAFALVAGATLGATYFGGLWWTVRRGLTAERPALWFFGSVVVRTAVALTGFYLVGGADWQRWLACLLGFVLARAAVHWLTRDTTATAQEGTHAP